MSVHISQNKLFLMAFTGQRINELENGPSSYRLKVEYFGSNRVGFDVV